jgi:hypothetical protein
VAEPAAGIAIIDRGVGRREIAERQQPVEAGDADESEDGVGNEAE